MYKAKVYVHLKKSVFDPQGDTVLHALQSMDFESAKGVRVGKYFEVDLETKDEKTAKAQVEEICDKLLVNPVIEDYEFELETA